MRMFLFISRGVSTITIFNPSYNEDTYSDCSGLRPRPTRERGIFKERELKLTNSNIISIFVVDVVRLWFSFVLSLTVCQVQPILLTMPVQFCFIISVNNIFTLECCSGLKFQHEPNLGLTANKKNPKISLKPI